MSYHYEALNAQKFQKFAEALILAKHPDTQCLPVGQPDGGRDAFFFDPASTDNGFVVFQVKYSLHPSNKEERTVIEELIKSEQDKVRELISRGATHYYLVTNVQGTAHLGSGSIDKSNALLSERFGIQSQVWWRDDLDGHLDNALDVKWSYPEVIHASDLIPLLLQLLGKSDETQSDLALNRYIASQYEADREVKFKQVDLKRALTDLFVDLPMGQKLHEEEREGGRRPPRSNVSELLENYMRRLEIDDEFRDNGERPFAHWSWGLAASFLLQLPLITGVSRFVLEGAPGQGKSTVTQYLCQVHRLRMLKRQSELTKVHDEHTAGPLRVPFRVDLRHYATWVTGEHPFAQPGEEPEPVRGPRSLESFLAMQVAWFGSTEFTQSDLLRVLEHSHSVIVLDGFDEVAETSIRARLVEEICNATGRLSVHARSVQIVVTSRPAAFANSPGFPEDDWIHLELRDLRRNNIEAYKDKWIVAQRLNDEERAMVSSTLAEKLSQPHLRDLARNPMQLSILLHLIHVQGPALPDKRTRLYEKYMELFFNREAEKSNVVRDHRELIISIHGVLAWVLQTEAEKGGSGSIEKDRLHTEIKKFLQKDGHDPNLADRLLTGAFERVGALVSRAQGKFEFEVQPLREYFAAQHLYVTSPYSPPGESQSGTRPERFDALARSLYWTNVARFFCGFYDVGELGTLVSGLIQFGDEDGYCLVNQPRRLALMLLSDHVFGQLPKEMNRLIRYVIQEPAFYRLAVQGMLQRSLDMELPETAGRSILFQDCVELLNDATDPTRQRILRQVMTANADADELKTTWQKRFREGLMDCDPLREAMDFGIIRRFTPQEIKLLAADNVDLRLRWLAQTGHHQEIAQDAELHKAACTAFFDGQLAFPRRPHPQEPTTYLEVLTMLLNVHSIAEIFSSSPGRPATQVLLERGFGGKNLLDQDQSEKSSNPNTDPLLSFVRSATALFKSDVGEWQTQLKPWSTLVNAGIEVAPAGSLFAQIAVISTVCETATNSPIWHPDGFALTNGIVERLGFARSRGNNAQWWREQLGHLRSDTTVVCLTVLLSWCEPRVLFELKPLFEPIVNELDEEQWSRLYYFVMSVAQAANDRRPPLNRSWFRDAGVLSPRVALAIISRVEARTEKRVLSRRLFADYEGTDRRILRSAATYELGLPEQTDVDWEFVSRLSRFARKSDLTILLPTPRSQFLDVPEHIATSVLGDSHNHCNQFVAICERAQGLRVAEAAPKVSTVAAKDKWFPVQAP